MRARCVRRPVFRQRNQKVLERAESRVKRSHGAVFVGTRKGDIEGQDLVGIPGRGQLISPPTSRRDRLSIWSMIDPTLGPMERVSEEANTAEELTSESWYWGRISSTSATNLPRALWKRDRRA
jgi:hypothetical protein